MKQIVVLVVVVAFFLGTAFPSIGAEKERSVGAIASLLDSAQRMQTKDFNGALALVEEAIRLARKESHLASLGLAYKKRGMIQYFNGSFDEALKSYLQAIEHYNSINDAKGVADVENEIGHLYKKRDNLESSMEHFAGAMRQFGLLKDSIGYASAMNNVGMVLEMQGHLDSALSLYKTSLLIKERQQDSLGVPYNLDNIAQIYGKKGEFALAINYMQEALMLRTNYGDLNGAAITLNNIGEVYIEQKKYSESVPFLQRSLDLSVQIGFRDLMQHTLALAAEVYRELGDYQAAFEHLQRARVIRDELYEESKSRQIEEMRTKYETEKKEKELLITAQEKEVVESSLARRNWQLALLGVVLLLAAISVFFLFRQQQFKQRRIKDAAILQQRESELKANIEGEENERKRLALELHDGLGQVLSSLKLNVSVLKSGDNEKEVSNSLEIIDDAVSELRNISHNLMPGTLIKLGLVSALKEFIDRINRANEVEIHFQTFGIEGRTDNNIEIALFRMAQELVNNALKYAAASSITMQLIADEGELALSVEDNGKGFDMQATRMGIGLSNVELRVRMLQGQVDIDSREGHGTSVHIAIPNAKFASV